MPLLVADQRSEGWFKARVHRVTASVAAGALGLHPHMSRQEAWRRCLGIQKESSSRAADWGVQFEEHAKQEYEIETGRFIEPTGFWVHPVYDFLGASPDGLVGPDGLYEGKAPGKLPESVPIYHRIQMIVQMIVCERSFCDYFCWIPKEMYYDENGDPTHAPNTFLRRVHLAGAQGIIRKLEAFYREFVLPAKEPPRKETETEESVMKTKMIGTRTVKVDLAHWASSVMTFQGDDDKYPTLYGYDLLRPLPDLQPGHGIVLRVTVEVIEKGRPCSHRNSSDKQKCTNTEPPRKKPKRRSKGAA